MLINISLNKLNKPLVFALLLIIVTAVLRLLVAGNTGLGIGEAYYFRGALVPGLSYFNQPLFFSGMEIC